MNININEIPIYVLHCNKYPCRINNVKKIFKRYTICNSNTTKYTHQRNVAYDLIELIIIAISENKYPFIILEDDAVLIDSIPQNIIIPENADLIYLGSNICSGPPATDNKIYLENYNEIYYRIYNSQSGHAILVTNKKSALFFKDILLESLIYDKYHDVLLPNISSSKIFLTPKDGPYFYQKDGKNERITKFKWKNTKILIK